MNTLEEALEDIIKQSFLKKNSNKYGKKQEEDLLFFPRNKLRMIKIRSGNWEPRAWFIQHRTKEKATKLEQPTEVAHEGLTSGYRSGIIKEKDGKYLKLKGICLGTLVGEPKERGLCDAGEAAGEQINAIGLTYQDLSALQIRPRYLKTHFFPAKLEVKDFLKKFNQQRKAVYTRKIKEHDKEGW